MDIFEGIKEALTDAFGDEMDVSGVKPETDLRADLGFNSIGLLTIAVSLEEKFGFTFTNEDFAKINTVGDVVEVIKSRS